MQMYRLETERLILRPWCPDDVEALFDYACSPLVGPAAGWVPHHTLEDSRSVLEGVFLNNAFAWAVMRASDQVVIGSASLRKDEKRTASHAVALGYSLGPKYWGQGYGTEAARCLVVHAFRRCEAETLACYHYPDNERSRRVILKCGFTYEGRLRNCAELQLPGQPPLVRDECCYSMTRTEFERIYAGVKEQ